MGFSLQDLQQLGLSSLASPNQNALPPLPDSNASFDPSIGAGYSNQSPAPDNGMNSEASGIPPRLGMALVGAPAPSQPSTNIQGPDTPITGKGPAQAAPDYNQIARQRVMDMLGGSNQDLQDAQEESRQKRLSNGVLQALSAGLSTATNTKVNPDLFKSAEQGAEAPVKNLQDQQANKMKQLQLADEQQKAVSAFESNDPNNPAVKAYRDAAIKIAQTAGVDSSHIKDMSPAQVESYVKTVSPALDAQLKIQAIKATREDARAAKESGEQLKASSALTDKLQQLQSRGSVKNAYDAERQINNAESLLNRYPDLNKMPQAQVNLLIAELSKISGGGAATEAGQNDLRPSSGISAFESGLAKLTNKPTGAQLGAFLNENRGYLADLKKNSQTAIGRAIQNTMMGYKKRLSKEDYQDLQNNPNYQDYLSAANASHGGQSYGQDVLDYAKSHGLTPEQANQIKLQRTGGQ